MAAPSVVRRETEIPAPPAAVFAVLTDPEKILSRIGRGASGAASGWTPSRRGRERERRAHDVFREVVPAHRLADSFRSEGREHAPPGSSLIEIDLIEEMAAPAPADPHRSSRRREVRQPRRRLGLVPRQNWP